MAQPDEAIAALQQRLEALEQVCVKLQLRVSALEAHDGSGGQPDFKMPDEEQTV